MDVISCIITDDVNFNYLAERVFVSLIYCINNYFPPPFHTMHFRGRCYVQPTFIGCGISALSLMVEYLLIHKLFDFLLYGDLSVGPHLLLTQSFVYNIDTEIFILYFGLYTNSTLFIVELKLFQLWPWGAPSVGSYVPLTYSYHCVFEH